MFPRRGSSTTIRTSPSSIRIERTCEGASYVAQRTVERGDNRVPDRSTIEAKLTDKQREALETAHRAGYFDWPRESTGEEIADRLGVSPATFTQHLRAAEGKMFDATFDGDGEGDQR